MDKHVFTDKQKKLIAWAAIAIFLLLSAAVGWFIGRPLVRFASGRRSSASGWTATACWAWPPMWAWCFCRWRWP